MWLTTAEYTAFYVHNKSFIKMDHMFGHSTCLNKFKTTEIIETVFSNPVKLNLKWRTKICIENPQILENKDDISKQLSCCCSGAQSCLTLCDPTDCSTPGLPVLHCLLELAQTHVHWVSDAIQPSHLLSPPSPLALRLSQHQGSFPVSQFFALGGQSIRASALAYSGLISS